MIAITKRLTINGALVRDGLIQSFWERVLIGEDDECWPWTAGLNSRKPGFNYGVLWVNGAHVLAHRFALTLSLQRPLLLPETLHACDNPPCCNPGHLREGTHTDNMQDMARRERRQCERGEARHCAKLTEAEVLEIRRIGANSTHTDLAYRYGVDRRVISGILDRTRWKHVS